MTTTPVRQITINATLEGDSAITTLPPHDGMIHDIVLSEDRRFLVTASQDRRIRVWTMPEERLLHTLEGHADDVSSSPSSSHLGSFFFYLVIDCFIIVFRC